jgi:hypothetical protein
LSVPHFHLATGRELKDTPRTDIQTVRDVPEVAGRISGQTF